jgi:hypothetical protein
VVGLLVVGTCASKLVRDAVGGARWESTHAASVKSRTLGRTICFAAWRTLVMTFLLAATEGRPGATPTVRAATQADAPPRVSATRESGERQLVAMRHRVAAMVTGPEERIHGAPRFAHRLSLD